MSLWIFLFLSFGAHLSAQPKAPPIPPAIQADLSRLRQDISELRSKLDNTQADIKSVDRDTGILETTYESIQAQMSITGVMLAVAGLIWAALSVGLGWFVSAKATAMSAEIAKAEKMQSELRPLLENLDRHADKIFNDVQSREIEYYLGRLEFEPEEIVNLWPRLSNYPLTPAHFKRLLALYHRSKNSTFLAQCAQHDFKSFITLTCVDEQDKINCLSDTKFFPSEMKVFNQHAIELFHDAGSDPSRILRAADTHALIFTIKIVTRHNEWAALQQLWDSNPAFYTKVMEQIQPLGNFAPGKKADVELALSSKGISASAIVAKDKNEFALRIFGKPFEKLTSPRRDHINHLAERLS